MQASACAAGANKVSCGQVLIRFSCPEEKLVKLWFSSLKYYETEEGVITTVSKHRNHAGPLLSRKRFIFMISLILLLGVSGVFATAGYVGWNLTHPVREQVGINPSAYNMDYEEVSFTSRSDGINLEGWLIRAEENNKTVIFAHGYSKNRLNDDVPILAIARQLVQSGCNVLMFDFRNAGLSGGNMTSVGQYEVRDLLGAVDYIVSKPDLNQEIVLYGFSMGAATSLLAGAREPAVAAVIADSPFADLKPYLTSNLSVWTGLPAIPFNQAFLIVVPLITGLQPEQVSPVSEISNFNDRPVLLIHGEADQDIPIKNSEELREKYPQARLVRVPGAAHVKSYETWGDRYMEEVLDFLNNSIPCPRVP